LPEALKTAVRFALVDLANDPKARSVLRRGHIAGFVPVQDSTYGSIRAMRAVANGCHNCGTCPRNPRNKWPTRDYRRCSCCHCSG
jgi:hypothetical protein